MTNRATAIIRCPVCGNIEEQLPMEWRQIPCPECLRNWLVEQGVPVMVEVTIEQSK